MHVWLENATTAEDQVPAMQSTQFTGFETAFSHCPGKHIGWQADADVDPDDDCSPN